MEFDKQSFPKPIAGSQSTRRMDPSGSARPAGLPGIGVLALVFLVLIAGAVGLGGCSLLPREEVEAPPPLEKPPQEQLALHEVVRGYVAREVTAIGRVSAAKEMDLYFPVGGMVTSVGVSVDSSVTKGQVLAELDVEDLKYDVKLAQLDLNEAEVPLRRLEALVKAGAPVNKDELELARIRREKASLRLERLNSLLERSTLRAPFSGRVIAVNARLGDRVQAYQSVVKLADPSSLDVEVELDEGAFDLVRPLQKANIGLSAERQAIGRVYWVSSGAPDQSGRQDRRAKIRLEDGSVRLQYGDIYPVAIVIQEVKDALLVPNSTIREYAGGKRFVRVMEGEARREVDVETGIVGATQTQILTGLEEGQQVIGR